jgi:hypothetical protein
MSAKSIGYKRLSGVDKAKQYVMPDITISSSGQILSLKEGTPPSNVVVDDSLTDLTRTYNQQTKQQSRLDTAYDELADEVSDVQSSVDDLKTKADALFVLVDLLNNDLNSDVPSSLTFSFDFANNNNLPQNLLRVGPLNPPPYNTLLVDPIRLSSGFYYLDFRMMLRQRSGPITIDGVDYTAIDTNGASNVCVNVAVYLDDVLYQTFNGCGKDWEINQIYAKGNTYFNLSTESFLTIYLWFSAQLPFTLDSVNDKQCMSFEFADNPIQTYPNFNGYGWMNTNTYGSNTLQIWKLNDV